MLGRLIPDSMNDSTIIMLKFTAGNCSSNRIYSRVGITADDDRCTCAKVEHGAIFEFRMTPCRY